MKVIIAGTRTIRDYAAVVRAIKESGFTITQVVSGAAWGVDRLGERWAEANNVPIERFHAEWNRYGRAAGPRRNVRMAEYADALILVWDGRSAGSRNMLFEAKKRELTIFQKLIT
jgi:hypothetical protein